MKRATKTAYIKAISLLTFLCVVFAASAIINASRAKRYKTSVLVSSERAVSELCENLDKITVDLQKSLFCNTEPMLAFLGTELYKSSAAAKVGLGELTEKDTESFEIYKFLSQVGDYTLALDKRLSNGETLTSEDRKALGALYDYSLSLSSGMEKLRNGAYENTVSFEKAVSTLSLDKSENAAYFSDSLNDTEQALTDYPTLVYDGPFADSVLNREALFVKDKEQITEEEARKKAASLLSCRETELHTDSEENGALGLFCFSKGEKAVALTKKGGFLCYMTNPDFSLEAKLEEKQAAARAAEFLKSEGFLNMSESYFSTYDGVCTVNFAFKENGVIYYSDLIKVSVALDSGKVVAVDARGFLSNHTKRTLSKPAVSLEKAKSTLSPLLSFKSDALALIPCKDGKERFCRELHVSDSKGQEALVYIDAETGEEADVLLLLYSDGGVLTK